MTQKEIKRLFIDICGRLKSNLICRVTYKDSEGWKEEDMVLSGIIDDEGYFTSENGSAYSSEFKPYLRPFESMTDEEYEDYNGIAGFGTYEQVMEDRLDWLISNHFDFRGLIEKGLALEAPEGMYKF